MELKCGYRHDNAQFTGRGVRSGKREGLVPAPYRKQSQGVSFRVGVSVSLLFMALDKERPFSASFGS